MQQGDVLIKHTQNGGDITVESGMLVMTAGLASLVYLALFGGNELDKGTDKKRTWWGNIGEPNQSRHLVSRFESALLTLVPLSGSLRSLEDAASLDLNFLLTEKLATKVTPRATIPGINRVAVSISIAGDYPAEFNYQLPWGAPVA